MTDAKISLDQQISAVEVAAVQAEQGARYAGMSTGGFSAYLRAAASTLRKLQAGEYLIVRKGELQPSVWDDE